MLFTSLQLCMNDEDWFRRTYEKLGTAERMGMNSNDLIASMNRLIDYMEDRADDIKITVTVNGEKVQMFNERETSHMVDVKVLYLSWRTARSAMFFLGVLFLIAAALLQKRREAAATYAKGFLIGMGVFFLAILALGLWAAADFDSFWVAFHKLFFSNDLWQLDPDTSRMINMCPEALFSSIILRFTIFFLVAAGAIASVSAVYLAYRHRRHKTPMAKRD